MVAFRFGSAYGGMLRSSFSGLRSHGSRVRCPTNRCGLRRTRASVGAARRLGHTRDPERCFPGDHAVGGVAAAWACGMNCIGDVPGRRLLDERLAGGGARRRRGSRRSDATRNRYLLRRSSGQMEAPGGSSASTDEALEFVAVWLYAETGGRLPLTLFLHETHRVRVRRLEGGRSEVHYRLSVEWAGLGSPKATTARWVWYVHQPYGNPVRLNRICSAITAVRDGECVRTVRARGSAVARAVGDLNVVVGPARGRRRGCAGTTSRGWDWPPCWGRGPDPRTLESWRGVGRTGVATPYAGGCCRHGVGGGGGRSNVSRHG